MPDRPPFVKLQRTPEAWDLMTLDPDAFVLLSQIAYRANRTPFTNVRNLQPGQAFIGDFKRCGFTEQTYRTAKAHLEKYGLVTFQPTTKGTIATITGTTVYDINIDEGNGQSNVVPTSPQRHRNVTPTTNKNIRREEGKKEKKEDTYKLQFLDFVMLTQDEYDRLVERFGKTGADDRIQDLNNGIGSKGYKYKSHYHTILSWDTKHKKEKSSSSSLFNVPCQRCGQPSDFSKPDNSGVQCHWCKACQPGLYRQVTGREP